ncbi:hypothetical protein ACWEQJ_33375, partial [Streptomyces cyaneofuscatus]
MPLLEPDPEALRPGTARAPAPDRVTDGSAAGTQEPLRSELTALLGADKVLWATSTVSRSVPCVRVTGMTGA